MALKDSFTGGGNKGGNSQQDLMNKAMSFAGKHFDQAGGNGNKQDAMEKAKETVAKLYIKHKINSVVGGGSSSGLDGLLNKIL